MVRFRLLAGLFLLSAFFLYLLLAPSALPNSYRMAQKEKKLQNDILEISEEIRKLTDEIALLQANSAASWQYIKHLARNDLGMIGPNEQIIILDK